MASTSSSALVPASVEAVWATLARFGDLSEWGTGVAQSSLLTKADEGLGMTRRVQVGRNALRETVTVWEPLGRIGYRILGLPPVVIAASNTWTLAVEGHATRVTLTSEAQSKAGPLVSRLVARKLGRAGKGLVQDLLEHHTGARA
jgi:hypothetical protein